MKIETPKKVMNIAYDGKLTKKEALLVKETSSNSLLDVKVFSDENRQMISIEAEDIDKLFQVFEQYAKVFSQEKKEFRAFFCVDVKIDLEEEDALDFMGKYINVPGELPVPGLEVRFIYEENKRILMVHMQRIGEKKIIINVTDVLDEEWEIQTSYAASIAAVHKIIEF